MSWREGTPVAEAAETVTFLGLFWSGVPKGRADSITRGNDEVVGVLLLVPVSSPFALMPDIFLHIPKTGGMSAQTALKWVYGPGSVHHLPAEDHTLSQWEASEAPARVQPQDLVTGHAPYGVHRQLAGRCRYFTLLRHPIKRVVSHYFYHRARYPKSLLASLSLQEFLLSDHSIADANRQVRLLAATDPGTEPEAALATAKDRLRHDFAAVGLTERFEESLLLFRRRLGWTRMPFYVSRNVNTDRPSTAELPEDSVEAVRAQNQLDLALYHFARERFETAWEAMARDVEQELRRFRRWNHLVQAVAPPLLWLYRNGRGFFT